MEKINGKEGGRDEGRSLEGFPSLFLSPIPAGPSVDSPAPSGCQTRPGLVLHSRPCWAFLAVPQALSSKMEAWGRIGEGEACVSSPPVITPTFSVFLSLRPAEASQCLLWSWIPAGQQRRHKERVVWKHGVSPVASAPLCDT